MRFWTSLFSFIMLIIVISSLGFYLVARNYDSAGPLTKQKVFFVKNGQGLSEIAQQLEKEKIVDYGFVIKAAAYVTKIHNQIKAGEYELPASISPKQILEKMVAGDVVEHKITVVEGKTVYDTLQEIKNNPKLVGDITIYPVEGTLMPETYLFQRGTTRDALITRMRDAQKNLLTKLWDKRNRDIPVSSPKDALILASVVEKETGIASERPLVASVFVNRLKLGMKLQSDPTIIYGITKGQGKLERPIYRSDIMKDSGYNTYIIPALPPTPICNPSPEAIRAVLNPPPSDFIFFVADGTGGHKFSKTLSEHNDSVKQWRGIEKSRKQDLPDTDKLKNKAFQSSSDDDKEKQVNTADDILPTENTAPLDLDNTKEKKLVPLEKKQLQKKQLDRVPNEFINGI